MKRKITFFTLSLLMLGLAVMPGSSSAQKDCSGGGCLRRYHMCREAGGADQNPAEYDDTVCLSEYDSCVGACSARGKKP